jgi:hypothetical protein
MVSETVVGAAIGVTGAVIGSLATGAFNYLTTRQRLEAENARRHADYFLRERVDALSDLHSKLERCRQAYLYNWESVLSFDEFEVRQKVMSKFYAYEEAMSRASIFLEEDQMQAMRDVFEQFRTANGYFYWYARHGNRDGELDEEPPDEIRFSEAELRESVDAAREVLRSEISDPARYFDS